MNNQKDKKRNSQTEFSRWFGRQEHFLCSYHV